ncbi:5'-methylthioadenosine/S-adenosylhomocysteine nucleosidase family protein [Nitrospira sp. Kam-Ns4a]
MRIGVFSATRWEFDAVRRVFRGEEDGPRVPGTRTRAGRHGSCRVVLVQTGVGPEKAGTVCRTVLALVPLDLAVSTGFACALVPSRIGDLLIGTEAARYRAATPSPGPDLIVPCSTEAVARAVRTAEVAGLPAHTGRVATVPAVLWRAAEKHAMAEGAGSVGLDMESAEIGAAAAERRVPFLVVRAVSDLLDEDLPLDFNLFLARRGWVQGAWAVLANPARLAGLHRLRRQSGRAAERMSAFWSAFLDGLS